VPEASPAAEIPAGLFPHRFLTQDALREFVERFAQRLGLFFSKRLWGAVAWSIDRAPWVDSAVRALLSCCPTTRWRHPGLLQHDWLAVEDYDRWPCLSVRPPRRNQGRLATGALLNWHARVINAHDVYIDFRLAAEAQIPEISAGVGVPKGKATS